MKDGPFRMGAGVMECSGAVAVPSKEKGCFRKAKEETKGSITVSWIGDRERVSIAAPWNLSGHICHGESSKGLICQDSAYVILGFSLISIFL